MIISKIQGGLGNQMFQYAAGRALFERTKILGIQTEFLLDTSWYNETRISETPRAYHLNLFNLDTKIATESEIASARGGSLCIKLAKFWRKITGRYLVAYFSSVARPRINAYLDGYFQSEKYFEDAASVIRNAFTLKGARSTLYKEFLARIDSEVCPVSVHVRRGDYVMDEGSSSPLGTCDPSYYLHAANLITAKHPNVVFFIFSDDIAWAKENILAGEQRFFIEGTENEAEEMLLMSACAHHIIANSTFSWWGAWLDPKPEKVVIAPKRWAKQNEEWYSDIVPDTWIRL